MSFAVALQSAVFYFIACTPCAKVRHRHKARQKAKREREEKARFEAEMPHLYRHPSPFATNPYWSEEITMGPSLPKKGSSKNASQRGLVSAGKGNSRAGSSAAISTAGNTNPETTPRVLPADILEGDEPTGLSITASESTAGEGWNRKRYQREDEELWGHELSKTGHKLMDAIKQAKSSAGRYMETKLGKEKQITDGDRTSFYLTPRNPPVNDYHPPVVSSKPARRDGHQWMLQPPPPAKVMEGKIPVSRTASQTSVVSRRAIASEGSGLGRLVGERLVEARKRHGTDPLEPDLLSTSYQSRPRSKRTMTGSTTGGRSQMSVRSRSHSLSAESDESNDSPRRRRKPLPKRPLAPEVEAEDITGLGRDETALAPELPTPSTTLQRPKLQTIASSEASNESSGKQPSGRRQEFDAVMQAEASPRVPLKDRTNTPPETETADAKGRPTGSSIDSGLALQE